MVKHVHSPPRLFVVLLGICAEPLVDSFGRSPLPSHARAKLGQEHDSPDDICGVAECRNVFTCVAHS